MTKLEFDEAGIFTRLTDSGERRDAWTFELGDDGQTERVLIHSTYSYRVD
jgi:hypothetical protein